jgi:hypothetical protein
MAVDPLKKLEDSSRRHASSPLHGTVADAPARKRRVLPSLTTAQVAEVLVTLRVRLLRLLERRGVIERDDVTEGFTLLPSDATDPEPVLAQLSAAAVTGTVPAGPERRWRPPLRRVPDREPRVLGALCASDSGLSLHAATITKRDDDAGKEALCRYLLRPPWHRAARCGRADERARKGFARA